jgi:hypothetical protein
LGISLGAIEQSFKEDLTAGCDALKESLDRGSKIMLVSDDPVETSATATGATPGETVVVVTGATVVVVVRGDTVVVVGEPPIGDDPLLTVYVLKNSGPIGSKSLS